MRLWWDILRWLCTPWVMPRTVKDKGPKCGFDCINVGNLEREIGELCRWPGVESSFLQLSSLRSLILFWCK